MINLDKLYTYLKSDSNYIRLKELETYFDSNSHVLDLINRKQEISKNLVNSRYVGLRENAKNLKEEYDKINEEILNTPLLTEYLDLLDYYYNLLSEITSYIENKINKSLYSK